MISPFSPSTLSEALDKSKKKYQAKLRKMEQQFLLHTSVSNSPHEGSSARAFPPSAIPVPRARAGLASGRK